MSLNIFCRYHCLTPKSETYFQPKHRPSCAGSLWKSISMNDVAYEPHPFHYGPFHTSLFWGTSCCHKLTIAPSKSKVVMMTSWNGNIFRASGTLSREFTGDRWIPLTKSSDADLTVFSSICARTNGVNNGYASDLRHHRTHYDVTVMVMIAIKAHPCTCSNTGTMNREHLHASVYLGELTRRVSFVIIHLPLRFLALQLMVTLCHGHVFRIIGPW